MFRNSKGYSARFLLSKKNEPIEKSILRWRHLGWNVDPSRLKQDTSRSIKNITTWTSTGPHNSDDSTKESQITSETSSDIDQS